MFIGQLESDGTKTLLLKIFFQKININYRSGQLKSPPKLYSHTLGLQSEHGDI